MMANEYRVEGETAIVTLSQGQCATIDLADLPLVLAYRWHAHKREEDGWYARHGAGGEIVYMHRLIASPDGALGVDHRDGDGLNNRRDNLRPATTAQNGQNRRGPNANNRTGIRGVHVDSSGTRYQVRVMLERKSYHGGLFPLTPEGLRSAEAAAIDLRAKLHTFLPVSGA